MKDWPLGELGVAACVVAILGLLGVALYSYIEEATFDYSVCEATEQYEDRHTPMWIQYMPRTCGGEPSICTGGYNIIHPARDWTERLYICPEEDRWRVEAR